MATAIMLLTAATNVVTYPMQARGGVSTYLTTTPVAITATGWTNIWSTNNANVRVTCSTSTTITIKNRANATVDTLTFSGTVIIPIQPGWGITAASGGLNGTAWPF